MSAGNRRSKHSNSRTSRATAGCFQWHCPAQAHSTFHSAIISPSTTRQTSSWHAPVAPLAATAGSAATACTAALMRPPAARCRRPDTAASCWRTATGRRGAQGRPEVEALEACALACSCRERAAVTAATMMRRTVGWPQASGSRYWASCCRRCRRRRRMRLRTACWGVWRRLRAVLQIGGLHTILCRRCMHKQALLRRPRL